MCIIEIYHYFLKGLKAWIEQPLYPQAQAPLALRHDITLKTLAQSSLDFELALLPCLYSLRYAL